MSSNRTDLLDPPGADEFPRWLTLREASFLTGLDEASLKVLVSSGRVGCDRSLSRKLGEGYLLVPSKDLREVGLLAPPEELAATPSPAPTPDLDLAVEEPQPQVDEPQQPEAPAYPTTKRPRLWPRAARRGVIGGVLTILVLASLQPLLHGSQTFAVSGGQMAPAIRAGDLVFDRSMPAADIRPGDVITLVDEATGRSRTTRVRTIQRVGTFLRLEVRADRETNVTSMAVPFAGTIDRVQGRIAGIGGPLSRIPGHLDRHASLVLPGLALLAALVAWAFGRRRRAA